MLKPLKKLPGDSQEIRAINSLVEYVQAITPSRNSETKVKFTSRGFTMQSKVKAEGGGTGGNGRWA